MKLQQFSMELNIIIIMPDVENHVRYYLRKCDSVIAALLPYK